MMTDYVSPAKNTTFINTCLWKLFLKSAGKIVEIFDNLLIYRTKNLLKHEIEPRHITFAYSFDGYCRMYFKIVYEYNLP